MKGFFIKRQIKKQKTLTALKAYPRSVNKIGIFCSEDQCPDAGFITKLKTCFGSQSQFLKFVIGDNVEQNDRIVLNNKAFNVFGRLKAEHISKVLSQLDIAIDMTLEQSNIKEYALSIARNAYKISLGYFPGKAYNLSINLKDDQKELFADEIIKYHNILNHARR